MLLLDVECIDKYPCVRLISCQEAHEVLVVGTCHLPDVRLGDSLSKSEVLIVLVERNPHPILKVQIHLYCIHLNCVLPGVDHKVLVIENIKTDEPRHYFFPDKGDPRACNLMHSYPGIRGHGEYCVVT